MILANSCQELMTKLNLVMQCKPFGFKSLKHKSLKYGFNIFEKKNYDFLEVICVKLVN